MIAPAARMPPAAALVFKKSRREALWLLCCIGATSWDWKGVSRLLSTRAAALSIAPPRHFRANVLQRVILLHGADDAEADVIRFGHPPDALRPLRIAPQPILGGKRSGGAAAFVRRVT